MTIASTTMAAGAGGERGGKDPEGGVYDGHDGLHGAMSGHAGMAELHHRARRCARGFAPWREPGASLHPRRGKQTMGQGYGPIQCVSCTTVVQTRIPNGVSR